MLKYFLILLAFFASTAAKPWELVWPEGAAWYALSADADQFWIFESDIDRSSKYAGGFVTWMHGNHKNNKNVSYRKSVWRIRFDCQGGYYITAYSTYNAQGHILEEYDGYGSLAYIRPNTIYQQIEDKFCKA